MKDFLVLLYIPAAIALFCFAFSGAVRFLESKTKNKDRGFPSFVHKYSQLLALVLSVASIALSLMWFSGEFPDGTSVERAYSGGYEQGYQDAEDQGYGEGYDDGYFAGYGDGYYEAEQEKYSEEAAYESGWAAGFQECYDRYFEEDEQTFAEFTAKRKHKNNNSD